MPTDRQRISSGTPWESIAGYSRAIRVGDRVYVAGTTASDEQGKVIGPGDPEAQIRAILTKIERALIEAGSSMSDVVRTTMYVTDITQWEIFSRVHGEYFSEVRPASTMVQVAALIDPAMLIELEIDAVIT
jgi:enamine deaminase RidA (YjgF/YER057c/UK114 family)